MSIAWDIVTAVHKRLVAAKPGGLTSPSIVIRRRFEYDKATEQSPQLIVVGEDELVADEHTGGGIMVPYPVLIGLVSGRENRHELAKFEKDVREAVRHALHVTKLGAEVPTVYNADYDPRPSVDVSSWEGRYEVSAQRLTYFSEEQRNG